MRKFILAAALSYLAAPLAAEQFTLGDIVIDTPYSFETPQNAMAGAGYLTITNTGQTDERLVAVDAPFDRIELHRSVVDADGIAKMVKQPDGILIEAGATVMLEPGGLHVMFMGLGGEQLSKGETVDATLHFENAGSVEIMFDVKARGDKAQSHGDDHS